MMVKVDGEEERKRGACLMLPPNNNKRLACGAVDHCDRQGKGSVHWMSHDISGAKQCSSSEKQRAINAQATACVAKTHKRETYIYTCTLGSNNHKQRRASAACLV